LEIACLNALHIANIEIRCFGQGLLGHSLTYAFTPNIIPHLFEGGWQRL